jgi:hypothetical protein
MIDQGLGHGPNNALWHNTRTWYLKEGPAWHKMRERYLIFAVHVKRWVKAPPEGLKIEIRMATYY